MSVTKVREIRFYNNINNNSDITFHVLLLKGEKSDLYISTCIEEALCINFSSAMYSYTQKHLKSQKCLK